MKNSKQIATFVDDVLLTCQNFESVLETLKRTFQAVREIGVKISPGKCVLFATEIEAVGWSFRDEKFKMTDDRREALPFIISCDLEGN